MSGAQQSLLDQAPDEAPDAPASEHTTSVRLAIGLSYDGTDFHGIALQPGQRTVAGALCDALATRFGSELHLVVAGRTDAGVHALAQVVHVDVARAGLEASERAPVEIGSECRRLAASLDAQLPEDASCFRVLAVPPSFDARRSATSRRYRYLIDTGPRRSPIARRFAWQLGRDLDLAPMRIATDALLGEHDFAGYCRRPAGAPASLPRRVRAARWRALGDGRLCFEIEANAFCQQMVRSIVGVLVEIGEHRRSPADLRARLLSGSREGAAKVAPACGLCLIGVGYPPELGGDWC